MQLRDWEVRLGTPMSRLRHVALWGPAVGLAGRGHWTYDRLAAHLARVRALRTGPSGWFGLKLHLHHYRQWFTDRGWKLTELVMPQRWIYVTRRDRLAQAVSWERALQTGQWAAHQRALRAPRFDLGRLRARVDDIGRMEAEWEVLFDHLRVEPHRVAYEDLAVDFESTVRGVLAHLDEQVERVPNPPMARQADGISQHWLSRLREALDG
jgi:trehalose 2-sulfotransferase